jgi:hypothetical protein
MPTSAARQHPAVVAPVAIAILCDLIVEYAQVKRKFTIASKNM